MKLPPNTIIAAGVVIIENGQVLLCKEVKFDGQKSKFWMFPGGTMDENDINCTVLGIRSVKDSETERIIATVLRALPLVCQRPGRE